MKKSFKRQTGFKGRREEGVERKIIELIETLKAF